MGPDRLVFLVPITFFVCVTVIVLARIQAKSTPQVSNARLDEIAARLERMEQAIDAMAVETERISEGQRFTTKLLSERAPARSER
jgi:hypothetical protein